MSSVSPWAIGLSVVSNVLAVVGIVLMNKYIVEQDGYDFMVFLSFLHFASTSIGMYILLGLRVFTYAPIRLVDAVPVALGSLMSVAFMNLNLSHNSVGFYQLSKLACIPCTLLLQQILPSIQSAIKSITTSTTTSSSSSTSNSIAPAVSRNVKLSLIPITVGVGIATVYDLELNATGSVFASIAVVSTALAQLFTNSYQASLGCNAMQLLFHTAPIIAVGMLLLSPMFDDIGALMRWQYSPALVSRIGVSCALSLAVNISNYLVLGQTSALTYQVLGHMKTILILVLGVVVFKKRVDARNALGALIALVGVIAYTEIKRREAALQNKKALP